MRGFLTAILKIFKFVLILATIGALLYGFYVGMDFIFKDILSKQSLAVLSNFIVFLGILIFLMTKVVDTSSAMNKAQQAVSDEIYASENVKVESFHQQVLHFAQILKE